jgi:tellurite resistance protein TehA-like permease
MRPARLAGVATLHPASFALVMATGIVSMGCQLLVLPTAAAALFWMNALAYVALWALTCARVAWFPAAFAADVCHHGRAVGFFTTVAATGVLGSQMLLVGQSWNGAAGLWALTIVLWAVITYSVLTVLTVKAEKPPLPDGINGGWLLAVVAAQSVSVLGSQLAPGFGARAPQVMVFCLAMWLGGGMLYIWIIALIFYRYTFFVMKPTDLAPPYWINMGAMAISTLAGTLLAASAPHSPLMTELLPFVKGLTLLFWATATWWIPMLVVLGVWRHLYRRVPLQYDPLYWGAVFPLGMYAVCTVRLTQMIGAPYLLVIARVFLALALGAWGLTMVGLIRRLLSALGRGRLRESN